MTNLNKEFDLIKQKLDSMSIHEFDDMLDKCGIMTIKPSNSSDYVECLKRHFNRNDMYEKESKYNLKLNDEMFNFNIKDGQGVA